MIGYLRGKLKERDKGRLLIEVAGVGYEVMVTEKQARKLMLGDEVEHYVYTHVREDVLALYGFAQAGEKRLFERLISVSGIGPRTALSVMGTGRLEEIVEAIREGNVGFFTAVSGIGTKGAQRLIIELKSKLGGDETLDLNDQPNKEDALKGLVALGFARQEAMEALKKVNGKLSAEEQIRVVLRDGRR